MCWYWLNKTKKKYRGIDKKKSYEQYLKSKQWLNIRSHAISAMQCKCEFCNSKPVEVHHIFYPKLIDYGYEGIGSLIVVCRRCHQTLHGKFTKPIEKECPLCLTNIGSEYLIVKIKKYELDFQHICKDCHQIAIGKRYKSKNMTFIQYLKFVKEWQLNLYKKIP